MEIINSAASTELLRRDGRFVAPPTDPEEVVQRINRQLAIDSSDPITGDIYIRLFQTSPKYLVAISHNVKRHDLIQQTLGSSLLLQKSQTVNGYFVGQSESDELRVLNIRVPRQHLVLQLATPWQGYEDALKPMTVVIASVVLFGFCLSALGGWLLVSKTLRPISEIVKEASKMSGDRLEPTFVAAHTVADDEIGDLVNALNAMMSRVHRAVTSQRQFTADASHDLRTPLSILRGEMELALSRERTPNEYRGVLASGLEETDRLIRIVNDLRDLANSDFERDNLLRRQPIELVDLATKVINGFSRTAKEKRIKIGVSSLEERLTIAGDRSAIERALTNLIDNAINYTSDSGEVSVKLSRSVNQVIIEVVDTGQGIDESDLQRIFDRFYRGDKSRSSNGTGRTSNSGLGLAIVKSVAVAHGGTVSVKSELGRGSTFTITLPVAPDMLPPQDENNEDATTNGAILEAKADEALEKV